MKVYGELDRMRRKYKGITAQQLADVLDVSLADIEGYERGLTKRSLMQKAYAFGLQLAEQQQARNKL